MTKSKGYGTFDPSKYLSDCFAKDSSVMRGDYFVVKESFLQDIIDAYTPDRSKNLEEVLAKVNMELVGSLSYMSVSYEGPAVIVICRQPEGYKETYIPGRKKNLKDYEVSQLNGLVSLVEDRNRKNKLNKKDKPR